MSKDDYLSLGKKYLDNQITYGAPHWYEWRSKNWGTKWELGPADSILATGNSLSFESANNAPRPIVQALSRRFPDVVFTLEWADEDLGSNVGRASYQNGEIIDELIPKHQSKEAYEMSFDIRGGLPEDFGRVYDEKRGTYVHIEELEEEASQDLPSLDAQLKQARQQAANKKEIISEQDKNAHTPDQDLESER